MAFAEIIGTYFDYSLIAPLVLYVAGMVIYGVFVWHFYRFLAKKDIFGFDVHKYNVFEHDTLKKFFKSVLHFFEYVLLFPVFTFFWFAVLSLFLLFLSKSQTVNSILLIAMSIVATTRVAAYYNEDLAKDIAKMLPFGILAVFVIDPTVFSWGLVVERVYEIPTLVVAIIHYALFTVVLEFVLKFFHTISMWLKKDEEKN